MTTDIVQGLFGDTPYGIQMAQKKALDAAAFQHAQLDPFQRAAMGMYQGGGMLGGAGAEAMGMVNPQVEQARATEQALTGIDTSNPDSILQRAAQVQDPRLKMRLTQYAQQMKAQQQEMATKKAMELVQLHKANSEASPYAKINPKDYTPASMLKYAQTKNPADLVAADDAKQPAAVQEYLYAKQQGYKGSFEEWKRANKQEGTKVILPEQEKAFEKELGSGQAKELIEGRKVADEAVQMLQTNKIGRAIMDKGMITGFGANAIVGIGQALKQAGLNFGGDATSNAQAYTAVMAQNVGKLIKQFGSGTGLSDADREYATKMAGGLITVDEAAIRKTLDINDRAARNVIALHNKRAKGVKTNVPLTVDIPDEGSGDLAAAARAEIARRQGKK